jgi:hypothetical protein
MIGEEGGSSHNAKVPPFAEYISGTIAEWKVLRPAATGGSNNFVYRLSAEYETRDSTTEMVQLID